MVVGRTGMGSHKHAISGRAGKSPKLRHRMKMEAERNERKDRSKIKEPRQTVKELFK